MTDKRTHHRFKCCVTSYVDVLADDIVPLCGAFAAQYRGSARQALDLLFEADDLARRNGAERVTESDVRRARELLEKRQIEQSLLDLTTHGHLTLFAIALLANDGETPVRKGHVYDRYGQLDQTLDRDALSDRSVHSHLNELTMLGILERHEHIDLLLRVNAEESHHGISVRV